MTQWTPQRLHDFATADDLRISPLYSDGQTYGTPTWIWSVVVDGRLYVRAWHGQQSSWYQSAVSQRGGRMYLAGRNFRITFIPVAADSALTTRINRAYRQKYATSIYVLLMVQAGPQAATLEIRPADMKSERPV